MSLGAKFQTEALPDFVTKTAQASIDKFLPGSLLKRRACVRRVRASARQLRTAYWKNSPMSGADAACPGNELTPRVESMRRNVLWCWYSEVL